MTVALFRIHLEVADREAVWWAETPAVPGLSVAAPTLKELRILISEAVVANIGPDEPVELQLVAEESMSANPANLSVNGTADASRGVDARRLIAV